MVDVRMISDSEVVKILALEEGHYQDLKRLEIAPAKMSESVSAFSNASGGEMFVGIGEGGTKDRNSRFWLGFSDQEAANAHLQVLEKLLIPAGGYSAEFLSARSSPGYVLHVIIYKVKAIVVATSGVAYLRKGAQNISVKGEESLRRLRLDKGIESFEDETVRVDVDRILSSSISTKFTANVVPQTSMADWLRRQALIHQQLPTVAAVLHTMKSRKPFFLNVQLLSSIDIKLSWMRVKERH